MTAGCTTLDWFDSSLLPEDVENPKRLPLISIDRIRDQLRRSVEFAFLDVREELEFSRAQPLFAVNMPLGRIETHAWRLLPRLSVPIALFDDAQGIAGRAAEQLEAIGYYDITVVDGGLEAWQRAGGEIFRDVGVPSKAFGEWLEAEAETPSLSAVELKNLLDTDEGLVLLDVRPFHEYQVMNIPGSICCPGAELVLRAGELAQTPDTLVVVNCAGRTRSLVGAQSLLNSSLFKRVHALRNGTIGWLLAGLELEHGAKRTAPAQLSSANHSRAQTAASRVATSVGVQFLSRSEASHWERESDKRSLFRFDVRSPEEHQASHAPGFFPAPGGQLVQATDEYVAVRGARILLGDDDGVRAAMTGSWLRQMGWPEVGVLTDGFADQLTPGPASPAPTPAPTKVPSLTPAQLDDRLRARTAVVVDLTSSPEYERGHIPGAWFAIRSRLEQSVSELPREGELVLTSPDGLIAAFAQPEFENLSGRAVAALSGGSEAWSAAGLPLETGLTHLAVPAEDVYKRPYEGVDNAQAAMQDYIDWELGLVEQIRADGTACYNVLNPRGR